MPDTDRRRTPQHERRAQTRARLLDAAARLFADHGIDGVSVDAVAEAAERTSGAVYDHFGSKHGLLMAVLDTWTLQLVTTIDADFARSLDLEERLRTVAQRVVVSPDDRTARLLVLQQELLLRSARDEEVAAVVRRHVDEERRRLAAGFGRWIAEGLLPADAGPPEHLAFVFRAVMLELVRQRWLDPGTLDTEQTVAVLAATLRQHGHAALST